MSDRGAPSPIIAEARKRWQRCADAEQEQRTAILLAKQFRGGAQWPEAIKNAREGKGASIPGQPPMPARPCLVVDRLSQPVRQISNIIKQASFGFDVMPNGQGADEETAEIFKGILRRVQNESRGESPIEWAADGAIEGGIGWFRLRTDYVHETWTGDPSDPEVFDQEVKLERITNNLTVYCDPSASKPTRSDAQYMFVVEDLDRDEFERRWPKADLRGLEEFQSTGDMQGWVGDDTIRIAEYWRVTYTDRTFHQHDDGSIVEGGEAPTGTKQTRVMRTPIVTGSKINACEELETWEWAGSRIPVIPILGEELNIDGKPVLRGVITEGMDAQRMVNYTYSGAMEIFALGSKSPYIVAAGQIDNYKEIWQTANVYNYSSLPYDPVSIAGTLVDAPHRDTAEAPIQAAVMLMQTSEEAIKATTSTGDASLGSINPTAHSGRAIQALQGQSDLANSNYPDNVRRALIYAAQLMVEVIPKITRKGQILHVMGLDDEPDQVMVGQPYQKGPNGIPQASPPEVTPELAQLSQGLHTFYDLNHGTYAVTVTMGKATATKREEGAAALGELIPHLPPEMAAVATPDYVEQLSFPGAHKIAEKLRKTLPPQLQDQPEGGAAPLPPQVQAQLQQLGQQLQQAQLFIQTKQAEQQGMLQKAQMDGQIELQKAQLESQTRLEVAKIQAQASLVASELKAQTAEQELRIRQLESMVLTAKEQRLEGAKQSHDVGITAMKHLQEQQVLAQTQQHQQQIAGQAQAHQASQQAQQQQHATATQQAGIRADQQAAQDAAANAQAPDPGEAV